MSYIQKTIECIDCKYQMNIATGTFGTGIPRECPNCHKVLGYHVISQGWNAKNTSDTPSLKKL